MPATGESRMCESGFDTSSWSQTGGVVSATGEGRGLQPPAIGAGMVRVLKTRSLGGLARARQVRGSAPAAGAGLRVTACVPGCWQGQGNDMFLYLP